LGIVELADEKQRPAHFSPNYQAAIEQVAAESATYDFKEAVSKEQAKRRLMVLGSRCCGRPAFVIVPQAGANALLRWMKPFASIPATLGGVGGFPNARSCDGRLSCRWVVTYRSFWSRNGCRAGLRGNFRFPKALLNQGHMEVPPQRMTARSR